MASQVRRNEVFIPEHKVSPDDSREEVCRLVDRVRPFVSFLDSDVLVILLFADLVHARPEEEKDDSPEDIASERPNQSDIEVSVLIPPSLRSRKVLKSVFPQSSHLPYDGYWANTPSDPNDNKQ